jgi:hypothetical protein
MALHDDKPRIVTALSVIPGLACVRFAWPEDKTDMPCIVVGEASNMPADHRDNRERITELEYYVRVFSAKAAEISCIASEADDIMLSLGYSRRRSQDVDGVGIRQKMMLYRIYL